MRFHMTPEPLLYLITTFLLVPPPIAANPNPPQPTLAGFSYDTLLARWDCPQPSHTCGWHGQLCCPQGSGCYTNAKDQAECTPPASAWASSGAASQTASAAPSASVRCNDALSGSSCGDVCCKSTEYCSKLGTCAPAYGTQSAECSTSCSAQPGVKQTSASQAIVTRTLSPTTKIPYMTPVPTGANVTITQISSGSGLSGGAIAGIVVGVLVGLLILGIICFYCCLKGIWDGALALFGMNRRRKVTEVDEYTRRTHHSSGGKSRTWYGTPTRTKRREKEDHTERNLLGLGAGLAALWAILGLKRRREDRRKEDDRYSESYFSSDYYTSESSASSDDRRSERYSRREVRRSGSRRP